MSILLVDSYDSFTYNLKSLIESSTGAEVYTIHNDSYQLPRDISILNELLDSMDAIVIGPGPGNPSYASDVGIIPYLLKNCPHIPIMGICLGFQSFCLANGGEIGYLNEPVHGQVQEIQHIDDDELFKGFPKAFKSVRYHSIYVLNELVNGIVPLAYTQCLETNKKTLMSVKHAEYPHYGVQYHPESICSEFGNILMTNFWNISKSHNHKTNRLIKKNDGIKKDNHIIHNNPLIDEFIPTDKYCYQYQEVISNPFQDDVLKLCEFIKSNNDTNEFLLLNSALTPGKWTILGLPIANESDIISHSTESNSTVSLSKWGGAESEEEKLELDNNESIWTFISNYMKDKFYEPEIGDALLKECPFVGGLVGFFSYEEGGEYMNFNNLKKLTNGDVPDTKLCFIERFIAICEDKTYLVSIKQNDNDWMNSLNNKLINSNVDSFNNINKSVHNMIQNNDTVEIIKPDKASYEESFNKCQEYLKSGDSYELCLTRPTKILMPSYIESWEIYKNLVTKNPSPYSSYLNFKDSTLLSTSPERFISWDRIKSEMRPIKGTVKKTKDVDYERACKLLQIPKEIGENLMIVDLIRHDLFQLLKKVEVSKLMTVEEYKTVYQLVSVIDGYFENSKYKGIDLLKNSLPPGSMTGAPKKRSVELLQELEHNERRGLYSGVCGYWSINDKSDWSVIIRSLFNYSDDLISDGNVDCWRCGAGGAITVLSSFEGEWEEMLIKLDSVLQMF